MHQRKFAAKVQRALETLLSNRRDNRLDSLLSTGFSVEEVWDILRPLTWSWCKVEAGRQSRKEWCRQSLHQQLSHHTQGWRQACLLTACACRDSKGGSCVLALQWNKAILQPCGMLHTMLQVRTSPDNMTAFILWSCFPGREEVANRTLQTR